MTIGYTTWLDLLDGLPLSPLGQFAVGGSLGARREILIVTVVAGRLALAVAELGGQRLWPAWTVTPPTACTCPEDRSSAARRSWRGRREAPRGRRAPPCLPVVFRIVRPKFVRKREAQADDSAVAAEAPGLIAEPPERPIERGLAGPTCAAGRP